MENTVSWKTLLHYIYTNSPDTYYFSYPRIVGVVENELKRWELEGAENSSLRKKAGISPERFLKIFRFLLEQEFIKTDDRKDDNNHHIHLVLTIRGLDQAVKNEGLEQQNSLQSVIAQTGTVLALVAISTFLYRLIGLPNLPGIDLLISILIVIFMVAAGFLLGLLIKWVIVSSRRKK